MLICALLGVIILWQSIFHPRPPDGSEAYYAARRYVTARLVCPSTASFSWKPEAAKLLTRDPEVWTVGGCVDSQNRFGAMTRKWWYVKIQHQPNDSWSLLEIEID